MELMLPALFERFKKLPSRFYEKCWPSAGVAISTSNIRKYKLFNSVHPFNVDSYGTQLIKINGIEGNLLNDSGETFHSKERRNIPSDVFQIFTPCIIRKDFVIEVADFVYRPYKGLEMINYKIGEIPEEMRHLDINLYRNHWAFFYFERYLSIRTIFGTDDDDWERKSTMFKQNIPRKIQHVESEVWISKPRIKIWVKKICEQ